MSSDKGGLEGRDCVPYFKDDKNQIRFEFIYLILIFFLACLAMLALQLCSKIGISHSDKVALFSLFGGFFGGWVYDTKWFYLVTARGKSDQYKYHWQPHKFYWRVFAPYLSAIVAFSTYMLVASGVIPLDIENKSSGKFSFSISFLLGYFSDLVLSRLADWAKKTVPKASSDEK